MKVTWNQTEDSTETDITWVCESFVVTATQYDTGEWIVRHGEDVATEIYSRGIYTRDNAVNNAKACMRDLTAETAVEENE